MHAHSKLASSTKTDGQKPVYFSVSTKLNVRNVNSRLHKYGIHMYKAKKPYTKCKAVLNKYAEGNDTLLTRIQNVEEFICVNGEWFYATSKEEKEEFVKANEMTTCPLTSEQCNLIVALKTEWKHSVHKYKDGFAIESSSDGDWKKGKKGEQAEKKKSDMRQKLVQAKWDKFNSVKVEEHRLVCRGIPVEEVILKLLSFLTTEPTSIALDHRSFIYGIYSGLGSPADDVLFKQIRGEGAFRVKFKNLQNFLELVKQLEQLAPKTIEYQDVPTSKEFPQELEQGSSCDSLEGFREAAATGAFCTETIAQKTIVKCTDTKESEVVKVDYDEYDTWDNEDELDDDEPDAWGDYESDDDERDDESDDYKDYKDYKDFGDGAW